MTDVRGTVRLWLVPAVAVLLVVVLLGLSGGLRSGRGSQGRTAAAAEQLDLARWQLVVHSVELVPGEDYDPTLPPSLRVALRATFLGERSTYGFERGLVGVQGTGGGPLGTEEEPSVTSVRSDGFDPDVPQELELDFTWPKAPATPPAVVRVLVHDERLKDNYLFDADWVLQPTPVAHLDLPLTDQR